MDFKEIGKQQVGYGRVEKVEERCVGGGTLGIQVAKLLKVKLEWLENVWSHAICNWVL